MHEYHPPRRAFGPRLRAACAAAALALVALPAAGQAHAANIPMGGSHAYARHAPALSSPYGVHVAAAPAGFRPALDRRPTTVGALGRTAVRPTLSLGSAHALVNTAPRSGLTVIPSGDGGLTVIPYSGGSGGGIRPAIASCATGFVEGTSCTESLFTLVDNGPDGDSDDSDPTSQSVTITWGDGASDSTSGPNVVVSLISPGVFLVTGTHTYADEGTFTIGASASDTDGEAGSGSRSVNVAEGAMTGTGANITPTEGAAFSGQVASFADADADGVATDFTAKINWGDGTTTAGTVGGPAGGPFTVSGTHTYADEGKDTITVTLHQTLTNLDIATASGTATVGEGDAVTTTPASITAAEGSAVPAGTVVGSFTDTGYPTNTAGDFTASIDWGDGTTTNGTVVASQPAGVFSIEAPNGGHIYADEGTYTITVTFSDPGGTVTNVQIKSTATVTEGDSGILIPASITAVEGTAVPAGTTVGSFTDTGNPSQVAGDFTASIDWGDGTTTSGTVVGPTGGPFAIQAPTGGHTYADEGSFTITATFFDDSPSTLSAPIISSATVSEGDAFSAPTISFAPTVFTPFSGAVATCTNTGSYTTNPAGDFTASINWGDGTTDSGSNVTISGPVNGVYTISGSHTYLAAGNETVTVTMTDDGTGTAVCTGSTTITVAKANSTTTLTCNGSMSLTVVYGQAVTCVIDVTFAAPAIEGTPSGTVSLTANGSIALGSCTLSGGTCTVTFPPPFLNASATAYTLQATYGGDSNFNGSTSNTVSVTVNKADTNTSVTCSPNPANIGQSVTCTATVSVLPPGSGTPTGTVSFTDNGSPIPGCTNVPLVTPAETATCTTSYTAAQVGSHTIVATYSGDGNFNGSFGSFTEVVQGCSVTSALRVGVQALGVVTHDDNPAFPYPIHYITFAGGSGVGSFTARDPVIVLCVAPSTKNASATIVGTVSSTSTPSAFHPGDTVSVTVRLVNGVPGPATITDLTTSATYSMNPPFQFGSYLHITTP